MFIIDTKHIGNKKMLINKITYVGVIVITYLMLSSAINHYITLRLGEDIASVPGYNIHVGFNKGGFRIMEPSRFRPTILLQ